MALYPVSQRSRWHPLGRFAVLRTPRDLCFVERCFEHHLVSALPAAAGVDDACLS